MNLDRSRNWQLWSLACLLLVAACSADEKANPERGAKCKPGFIEHQKFCIRDKESDEDAGSDETMKPDSGKDAEVDAGKDAGMPQSCDKVGETDFCYSFGMTTAFQEPCKVGSWTCQEDHTWSQCIGEVGPNPETCDSEDNDCDGKTDEEQFQRCTVPDLKGACAENGVSVCNNGTRECLQSVKPKPESCNAIDDDCDGVVDEGLEIACYGGSVGCTANALEGYDCVPASTCAPGTLRCVDGQMQTECTDDVRPGDEKGTTAGQTPLDEDCDGRIDEGFDCSPGQTYPCYTGPANTRGRNPCHDGTQICDVNGDFGTCVNERTPEPETCANEGEDNDCDGEADDIPTRGTSCSDVSMTMGLCKQNALWQCVSDAETCVDAAASAEVCDGPGEDENCDGQANEGFNLQDDENHCGSCGNRCGAGQTCCGGSCVNTATSNAHCGGCMTACSSGLTCCNGGCVNTRTNISHCGMCNKGCLLGGVLGCSNGACL